MFNKKQPISWLNNSSLAFICVALSLIMGCGPKCIYENENYTDLGLYVSFKINGEEKKFYQIIPSIASGAEVVSLIYNQNNNYIYRNNYLFHFSENTARNYLLNRGYNGDFLLKFSYGYNYVSGNNTYDASPSKIFGNNMFFSYQKEGISQKIEDTYFMNGISLYWIKNDNINYLSTDNIFIRYNSKKDSILTYFKNSDVKITDYHEECSNFYIIEGTFNTKLETKAVQGENPMTVSLTDGHFRVLRQF